MDSVATLIALLDRMPNSGRGLLSALLLLLLLIGFDLWVRRGRRLESPAEDDDSWRGRWRRLRLSFDGYRWRTAHLKTSLLMLLLVPIASTVFTGARIPVFVETLPAAQGLNHWWLQGPLLLWLAVAGILMLRLLLQWSRDPAKLWQTLTVAQRAPSKSDQSTAAPEAIEKRTRHWQRRLGRASATTVRLSEVGVPSSFSAPSYTIALPRAAAHWPAAAIDVALIEQLCHFSLKHHRWLRFAALVGCLYWPFRYVRSLLPLQLERDFRTAALELAAACYRDPLGYRRAAKALAERLDVSFSVPSDSTPIESNEDDPYGRVFMVFVQMLLAIYVLTGTTLREVPDDSNFRYAEFVDDWYESFQRSIKYAPLDATDRQAGPSAPPVPAPEQ